MDKLLPELLSFPPRPEILRRISDTEYDARIRSLLQLLNTTPASLLVQTNDAGEDLLDILDPSRNSLPYLYALLARIQATTPEKGKGVDTASALAVTSPRGPLWARIVSFLDQFDARQVRAAGLEWRRLVETVAESARSIGKPLLAVRPIRNAILRLDPKSSTFTSNHVLFVKLCLEAKTFRAALPILDQDILDFPMTNPNTFSLPSSVSQPRSMLITPSSGLTAKLKTSDHLEYHLHGAMVYIGRKNWERALEFLTFAIAAPTIMAGVSAIILEAYKKWLLVSLILHGKTPAPPKGVSVPILKSYAALARPYDAFAEAFRTKNSLNLHEIYTEGRPIWVADSNLGLVSLALAAFRRFSIRHLDKTYVKLSLSQLCVCTARHHRSAAQRATAASAITDLVTGPNAHPPPNGAASVLDSIVAKVADVSQTKPLTEPDAEHLILSMVETSELKNATLAHHPLPHSSLSSSPLATTPLVILALPPASPPLSEPQQLRLLEAQLARTLALAEHVQRVDRRITMSKEYLGWVQRARREAVIAGEATETGGIPGPPGRVGFRDVGMMDIGWGDRGLVNDEDVMADI